MAIVKFVNAGSPMNNIFNYVTRSDATNRKLIDGVNCSPESALEEFRFVKKQFGKEDGRMYYHIIQSFAPDDRLSPKKAHEIGLKLAETHTNTNCLQDLICQGEILRFNTKNRGSRSFASAAPSLYAFSRVWI